MYVMDMQSHASLSPSAPVMHHDSRFVHSDVASTSDANVYAIGGRTIRFDSPDALLEAKVRRSLIATGRRPIAELTVQVESGRLWISGTVPSYYTKQLAHEAAMSVHGIASIESQIHVG